MLLHYSRAQRQVEEGIQTAEGELTRARKDAEKMGRFRDGVGRLEERARTIRERNGFEEIMRRVVEQGGTRPDGNPHNHRA